MMESLACDKSIVQNSAVPVLVPTEIARKLNCPAGDAACPAQVGTIYTFNIPTDGRQTLYLDCGASTPMCNI